VKVNLPQREEIRDELHRALDKMERLPREYKLKLLMGIYDKALFLNITPMNITYSDILSIKNAALTNIKEMPSKIFISGRTVYPDDARHIAMINATIGILNKLEALKRLPKINFTDRGGV